MIKKILFPTDFSSNSENAFQHALHWANTNKATIEVLYVESVETLMINDDFVKSYANVAQMNDIAVEMEQKIEIFIEKGKLRALDTIRIDKMPNIRHSLMYGSAFEKICQLAKKENFDLLVMATRGENHTFMDRILGTVSTYVVENAQIPVLLIPPNVRYEIPNTVVYATDLKATEPYRIWSVYQCLQDFHPTFHCMHIRNEDNNTKEIYLYELDNYFKAAHAHIPIHFHLVHVENLVEGMKTATSMWNADLLAMYVPQHTLLQKIFKHRRSQSMVNHLTMPMLFWK